MHPTNRVLYVLTRKDGSEVEVCGQVAKSDADLPRPGDPCRVEHVPGRVIAVAKTPSSIWTWTVMAIEEDGRAPVDLPEREHVPDNAFLGPGTSAPPAQADDPETARLSA